MLRPYQQLAFDAIQQDITVPGASLVVLPTGSGKSHIIAAAATLRQPVLILQPSQELLRQNYDKLAAIVDTNDIGIYSASFNRHEVHTYTFATIQSVYKKPELFMHIKTVIIDECHNLAPRTIDTMYPTFLSAIGSPKIIGTTATPFRLELGYYKTGGSLQQATMLKLLNRMRHRDAKELFWKRIIHINSYRELLDAGYLSPLEYIQQPLIPYQEIPVNISHSDYNLEGYTQAIIGQQAKILSTIAEAQRRYKSILVFCATTVQAQELSAIIRGSACVFGDTDTKERTAIIDGFKNGSIQTVFNMGVLTTGFDKPDLDCIILLRPTRSPVLYNQMLGRLTRIAPGKPKGTVIDLTDTVRAMGRIESFELYRNARGLWDLRTERHATWHDRVLFTRTIQ